MSKSKKETRRDYGVYFLVGAVACLLISFLIFTTGYEGFIQNIILVLMPLSLILGVGFIIASLLTKE